MPPKKRSTAAAAKAEEDVPMGDAPAVEEVTSASEAEISFEEQRIRIVQLKFAGLDTIS